MEKCIEAKEAEVSEHDEQRCFFDWVRLMENQDDRFKAIFAVPNGGQRHPAVAARLKAEGVRAGVWDVFCAVPKDGWSGLWLEFKFGKNRLTNEQKDFQRLMHGFGYKLAVVNSSTEAQQQIEIYLEEL